MYLFTVLVHSLLLAYRDRQTGIWGRVRNGDRVKSVVFRYVMQVCTMTLEHTVDVFGKNYKLNITVLNLENLTSFSIERVEGFLQ